MSVSYNHHLLADVPSPTLLDEDELREACEAAFYEGVLDPLTITVMRGGKRVMAFGDTGEGEEACDVLRDTLLKAGAVRVTWVLVSDVGAVGRVSTQDGSFTTAVSDLDEIRKSEDPAETLDALWQSGSLQMDPEE